MKPSQYLFDVLLDTEKKLLSQYTVKIPKPVELLCMSDTNHHKVEKNYDIFTELLIYLFERAV